MHRIFILITLLFVLPITTFSEWTDEGVELGWIYPVIRFQMLPDGEGGAWVASTQATGGVGATRCMLQRVNSNGELHFTAMGIHVVEDLAANTRLQGMVSDGQGGVIVAFSGFLPDGTQDRIYAQRFSPEGERLAGPDGILVSVEAGPGGEFSDPLARPRYHVASDLQGGIWVWWRTLGQFNIYVNGLNSDGSRKNPNSDLYFEEYDHDFKPKLIADSLGGAYIAWGPVETGPDQTLLLHHILADGTTETVDPYPAIEAAYIHDEFFPATRLGGDGLYITSSPHYQRLELPLNRLWGPEGIDPNFPDHDSHNAPPIVLADNSIAQMQKISFGDDSVHYARVREDGTVAVNTKIFSAEWPNSIICDSMPHSNGYWTYVFHRESFAIDGDFYINFRVHCVDTTGTDLFAGDSVYVWSTQYDHPSQYASGYIPRAIKVSDDAYIFGTPYDDGSHNLVGFKMYSDGSWAGRPWTDAPEPGDVTIPSTPKLVIDRVYPMPFNASVTFDLTVPTSGDVTLTLYTLTGQQVDVQRYPVHAGQNTFSYSAASHTISSGILFARLEGFGTTQVVKLVQVR